MLKRLLFLATASLAAGSLLAQTAQPAKPTQSAQTAPGPQPQQSPQPAQPTLFAPGAISGPVADAAPAFTPDGQTVYFHRSGPAMTATILVSHCQAGTWTKPDVAPFSGQWQDIEPAMSPDGSYLIFSSNRPTSPEGKALNGTWNGQHYPGGGGNLWRVDKRGKGWSEPHRLPDIINSDSSVFSPAVTADGALYFMKPVGDTGKFHLYRSAYENGTYQSPIAVPFSAADSVSDVDAAVAADESFIVFSSKRPPVKNMELFIVYRKNDRWTAPQPLGPEVNRGLYSIESRLSPDGKTLYFSSIWTTPKPTLPRQPGTANRELTSTEWETGQLNIWSWPLNPPQP